MIHSPVQKHNQKLFIEYFPSQADQYFPDNFNV